MKNLKIFNILLILAIVFSMPIVYAHEVTLDNDTIKITQLSGTDMYSKTKVTIADSYGEYNLYYQYVEISDEDYTSYSQILASQKAYKEENEPSESASNSVKAQYNEEMQKYEDSKEAILPTYVDANWIESKDNTVPLDTTKIIKTVQPYVLWVKVEPKTGNKEAAYNDLVVIYDAKNISSGSSEIIDESKVESPKTGDNIIFVGLGIALIAGIMVISYRKVNS